ncbi:MAG: FAD-binding oxidoreductase [Rhizobiales bacterium]|nr:FAD-binding oxidoreductase [Hyphomicrobiales bacterium]
MVTHKRKLRGGDPYWLAMGEPRLKTLSNAQRQLWDVIIVGAGITGALIAHRLTGLGQKVLILDRRPPLHGSTAASTALIQWDIDRTLTELAGRRGLNEAREIYRLSLNAVGTLERLIREENITCGWRARSALYLAGDAHGARALKAEADLREKAGLPSRFVDARHLREGHGLDRTGAILSRVAGELDPVRLAKALLTRAQAKGALLVSPLEVAVCEAGPHQVGLLAKDGRAFEARRVIFATGYETLKQILRSSYHVISTWALATKPLSRDQLWAGREIIWEASDPYLYLRTTPDNRIIAGGEDEAFADEEARDRLMASKSKTILRKLHELLPGRRLAIAHQWAGNFAETDDGLPIIAEPDGMNRCIAVLGAGGNGITFSVIAADIAAAWVRGRKLRGAKLFEPR